MQRLFRMRRIAAFLAILLVLCMVQPARLVLADDESDLEELEGERSEVRQQQEETDAELARVQAKVDEVMDAVAELDAQIGETVVELIKLDESIQENLTLLEQTKDELAQAEADEAIWYEKLKLRIQAMYESGDVNYLEVLLHAQSISELFSKVEYTRELAEYDRTVMDHLTESREKIADMKQKIEEEEAVLEQNRAEEELRKQELEEAAEEKNRELESLQDDQAALELLMQQLEEQEEEIDKQIEAKEEEIEERKAREAAAKAAAEAASKAAGATYTDYKPPAASASGSGMLWPVSGYSRLSTYFMEGGHRGIDIPAPAGTPIHAAASGTVIVSGWNGSYGNYVKLDNGNGLVTLYAHASALCVSVGDTVSIGETLALVGNTGYSFGNHLHFEVQVNGGLQNPLNYVSP